MRVDPITDPRDIRRIKRLLKDETRNLLLFTIGVNSGLRVQDILSLRLEAVASASVGDRITIREKKTGKQNVLMVNREIHEALGAHLAARGDCDPKEFLIRSRKGRNYPLTTYRVTHLVQQWCDAINLPGNYGAHTLRKTWCYQQRKQYGVSWELLAKRLNHSNPAVTRRYLGVQAEEVEEVLLNGI